MLCTIRKHSAAYAAIPQAVSPDHRRQILPVQAHGLLLLRGEIAHHIGLGSGGDVIPGKDIFDIEIPGRLQFIVGIAYVAPQQKALIQPVFQHLHRRRPKLLDAQQKAQRLAGPDRFIGRQGAENDGASVLYIGRQGLGGLPGVLFQRVPVQKQQNVLMVILPGPVKTGLDVHGFVQRHFPVFGPFGHRLIQAGILRARVHHLLPVGGRRPRRRGHPFLLRGMVDIVIVKVFPQHRGGEEQHQHDAEHGQHHHQISS